jgi:hypothetical protein
MKKPLVVLSAVALGLLLAGNAAASTGFYFGPEFGWAGPKFSYTNLDFEGNSAMLIGARAGFKFLFFAVEGNYLTSSHELSSTNNAFLWEGNKTHIQTLGINGKLFIPFPVIHPYISGGWGSYTVDIDDVGKETNGGYNIGGGLELGLGKISLFAEGKYHWVKVDIKGSDLDVSYWAATFGFLINF